MEPTTNPAEVAAIDEVFKTEPPPPLPPEVQPPALPAAPAAVTPEEDLPAERVGGPSPDSPLGDYTREIQLEFEKQQEGSEFLP